MAAARSSRQSRRGNAWRICGSDRNGVQRDASRQGGCVSPSEKYLEQARGLLANVQSQLPAISQAADWFSASILAGRMVHVFGSGHSRIMVEEMWPRYGSFPGFNPSGERSRTLH